MPLLSIRFQEFLSDQKMSSTWPRAEKFRGQIAQPRPTLFAAVVPVSCCLNQGVHSSAAPPAQGPTNSPQTPAKKQFSEELTLHEQDSGISHGVLVKVGEIGVNDGGPFATVSASADGGDDDAGMLKKGGILHPFSPHCDGLRVILKDATLENTSQFTWDELRKMGPAAEQFVSRNAKVIVTGRCEE